ncbi:MAG: (d)CMP kinase [Deltaproteobacteria bacterium]|nr:(d)CMP kinase [Deltaproteobacteria bacterium]
MNRKSQIANRKSERGPVIAIDGPAGSGKSTLAKLLAEKLRFTYIDTGAMYRAVALKAHEQKIDSDDENALKDLCAKIELRFAPSPSPLPKGEREKGEGASNKIFIDNEDYSEKIRTPFVSRLSSKVSSQKTVRDAMVRLQRLLAAKGSVIMEGRDIGTVVFPDADIKFYIDASPEIRGRRRYAELKGKGENVSLEKIIEDEKKRDLMDSTREHAPLKKADDAVYIDTSNMELQDVLAKTLKIVKEKLIIGNTCC